MTKVTILAGASGSGKSTFVDKLTKQAIAEEKSIVVCSADHYFEDADGNYNFDVNKLGQAHAECFRRYLNALDGAHPIGDIDTIVVDNTNTDLWQLSPYVLAATALAVEYEVVFLDVDPSVAASRNQHGLSESQVRRQYERLQRTMKNLPRGWKYRVVRDGSE